MDEYVVTCHLNYIEDEDGNVEDDERFCSDSCARSSEHYAGWNGCNEVNGPEWCEYCGESI